MLFSGSSANPACCLCTRSHKPLGCVNSTRKLWLPVQHRSSDYSKSSWWPLCPGWSDTEAVSVLANSAFTWYPKDHIRLLTLSYAVSAGPSAVEGKGIFLSLFSDMALNMHGGRRFHWCVVMSQRSFTSLVDIDGRESSSQRGSCVYLKVLTYGHSKSEPQAWDGEFGNSGAAHSKTHEDLRVIESQTICVSHQGTALKHQFQEVVYLPELERRAVSQIGHLEMTALLGTLCGSSKTGDKTPINVKGSRPRSVLPFLLTVIIFQFREENLPTYFSVSNCSVTRHK